MDEHGARAILNEIIDPCSAARGVPIGLADMGMVRAVEVVSDDDGFGIEATLRITSPGCMLAMDFEQQARLMFADAGATWVRIHWDTTFDWTHNDIAGPARERLARHRLKLVAAAASRR